MTNQAAPPPPGEQEQTPDNLQRFRFALDHSADAIFLVDRASLRFSDVNLTACQRLGYSREELLGMGPQDIAPYFNRQMLAARMDEIIASPERAGIIDSFHKRRDGSLFPVEVRLRATESEGRTILVAIARDMTEQRRSEEALRQNEEQFRQITENLQHMLWVADVDNERLLYISAAFEKIWGRSREQARKRPRMLLADIHPEDRGRITTAMQAIWQDDNAMDEEYRLLRKDGETRWLWTRTFPIRDGKGRVYRIGAVTEDITARKEQEENLRFSEERFRRLFEDSPIGINFVSLDLRIIEVNPAFCQMMGYSREEMLGKTISEITYHEDLKSDLTHAHKLLSGGIPFFTLEKRYVRKNGEAFWIKLQATTVHDNNKPIFAVGMVEDIDQAKRAEAIRLAREEAQKNALVREVHHRIKNHLQGVVGLLHRLRQKNGPCNAILEKTIAQINTVATVHGLQGKTAGEEIDLLEMTATISHAVSELIPSDFATLLNSTLDASPILDRDESVPLALALNELLVNARKFSTGPVKVEISGSRENATIHIVNPAHAPQPRIPISGLGLVKSLLQVEGAAFSFEHGNDRFSALIRLTPPVLRM